MIRKILFAILFLPLLAQAQDYDDPGLIWADGIEPGTASTCEATGGSTCYWVDCDAVTDGDGSFANPYWGFETVAGYMNGGSFVQGSLLGGDFLYVKGTCDSAESTEDATGPLKVLKIKRAAQYGTLTHPTVVKSYKGTSRAIFDMQQDTAIVSAIELEDATEAAGKYVHIQNVLVQDYYNRGIDCHGPTGCSLYNVEIKDGKANGDGVLGSAVFFAEGTQAYTHSVDRSYFHDNNVSPSGGANNQGSICLLSETTADAASVFNVTNSKFENEIKGIRHKHNGVITNNVVGNLFLNNDQAMYLRADTTVAHNNVMVNTTDWVFDMCSENLSTKVDLTAYNNTVYTSPRFVQTSCAPQDEDHHLTLYNNIFDDTSTSGVILGLATNSAEGFGLDDIIHDHNMYNIGSSAQTSFMERENTVRSFTNSMSDFSDSTSAVDDPEMTNPAGGDYSLDADSPARTFGRSSLYVGAIDPLAGLVIPDRLSRRGRSRPVR